MSKKRKRYTGYTSKTMENRVTGAGAYFKGYDIKTDTFDTAVSSGKLIGATKGGGNFTAKAVMRNIEVDGVPGKVKGMTEIDNWDVEMTANIIEVTEETLLLALGSALSETSTENTKYKKIIGKNVIEVKDYQDNITFLGTVSGFEEPVIIQIYNALSTEGLTFGTKDKDDVVIPMKFVGYYDEKTLDNPPYAIFIPIKESAEEEEA